MSAMPSSACTGLQEIQPIRNFRTFQLQRLVFHRVQAAFQCQIAFGIKSVNFSQPPVIRLDDETFSMRLGTCLSMPFLMQLKDCLCDIRETCKAWQGILFT